MRRRLPTIRLRTPAYTRTADPAPTVRISLASLVPAPPITLSELPSTTMSPSAGTSIAWGEPASAVLLGSDPLSLSKPIRLPCTTVDRLPAPSTIAAPALPEMRLPSNAVGEPITAPTTWSPGTLDPPTPIEMPMSFGTAVAPAASVPISLPRICGASTAPRIRTPWPAGSVPVALPEMTLSTIRSPDSVAGPSGPSTSIPMRLPRPICPASSVPTRFSLIRTSSAVAPDTEMPTALSTSTLSTSSTFEPRTSMPTSRPSTTLPLMPAPAAGTSMPIPPAAASGVPSGYRPM